MNQIIKNNPINITISECILLSLLWFLCSIPVLTIGASTTALYFATMKIVRNEKDNLIQNFFKSFKLNLSQSTTIWIIYAAIYTVLILNIKHWYTNVSSMRNIICILTGVVILILSFSFVYIFPLLARFTNTTPQLIKNSFIIAILNMKATITFLVIHVIICASIYFIPYTIVLYVLIGVGLIAYLLSFSYVKIFQMYEHTEEAAELQAEDTETEHTITAQNLSDFDENEEEQYIAVIEDNIQKPDVILDNDALRNTNEENEEN